MGYFPLIEVLVFINLIFYRDLNKKDSHRLDENPCAGGKGFEPLQTDSESAVLPLDEPPIWVRALFYH